MAESSAANSAHIAGCRNGPTTDLYYYRARYYSPRLGRFLQTDPVGTRDDLNLYLYTFNDPSNYSDPSGTWGLKVHNILTNESMQGRINFAGRQILMRISFVQDIGPNGAQNQMHFLRNPGQDLSQATANWRAFVSTRLNEARDLYQGGNFRASLQPFGEALHAIADSFSPVHNEEGQPAEFDPDWGPIDATRHGHSVTNETGHENTSDLTPELRAQIVAEMRAAYDAVYGGSQNTSSGASEQTKKPECTGSRIKQAEPC